MQRVPLRGNHSEWGRQRTSDTATQVAIDARSKRILQQGIRRDARIRRESTETRALSVCFGACRLSNPEEAALFYIVVSFALPTNRINAVSTL
jgi:hypothetical protein